ncbi:MAG: sodium/proline symporter PutP [Gammaproteobacteria bacterium]|nr:sodium/proline symporter PutP [Gammaproteobacteria bacterium]
MQTGAILSIGLYFLAMLGIGYYSYLKTKNNANGFVLGGRSLSPSVTALSAGASDMSGWMLMGLPGALFVSGLTSGWIAIGLVIGAYFNYLLVAPRLRVYTEVVNDAVTIPQYIERRFHDHSHVMRIVCAVVIVIFFAIYTTSGVVAGGKLFETSFGLNYQIGVMITAGVVVAYSAFGGFLAVSITDFVQGCIMFLALIVVPVVALSEIGGWSESSTILNSVDPALLSLQGVGVLGVISAASWGLGYFGQPHIIVRFMAIRSVGDIKLARRIGMSWMVITLIGACAVGLVGAAYVAKTSANLADPETIFIFLSTTLFHPFVAGFLLAAILAAIMSTISSQLLVTSTSLVEDIAQTLFLKDISAEKLVYYGRVAVVFVALLAIGLAQDRTSSILSLVSNAWAGFGASFGPVILLSLFWRRMTRSGALAGILVGTSVVLFWVYAPITIDGNSLSSFIYEIVPAFILATMAIVIVSLVSARPNELDNEFRIMEEKLRAEP